jgi:uncharacterized membrane protein (DUF4010 family)
VTREPIEIALGLGLALAVGALVGLERERYSHARPGATIGGARTFPLVGLLGGISALLADVFGGLVLAAGFAAVTVLVALGYRQTRALQEEADAGLTTELAALVIFAVGALPFAELGGMSFPQRLLTAGAVGTVVMGLLALREPIHGFARALSQDDLLATFRFSLIALVVLPLLPDEAYGPFDAFNPFRIGVVIVLIAGISFVGYVAVRALGPQRGIGVTALAGGLVSSTAVTLTFAGKARENRDLAPACAFAIALAATIMFARVMVEILVVNPALVDAAVVPLATMLAAGGIGCALLWRHAVRTPMSAEPKGMTNPFRLRQALRLGLAYALIRFIASAAWESFGSGGLYASAALSGLADVDAITISVANMHRHGLATGTAVGAITVAVVANTLVKAGIVVFLGGRRVAVAVAAVLLPVAAIGAIVGLSGG